MMIQKAQLEVACFNLQSALIAQQNGAHRVELCDKMEEGGITPSIEMVRESAKLLTIDRYVMIRPRGGNFVYSSVEFQQMKTQITQYKNQGVNGFVFGILTANNHIDLSRNKELVAEASPLPCTFHRAFDEVLNPFQSLEEIIDCNFQTILTSGQAQNAVEGISLLSQLVKKANGRITIMPGGGLRSSNIEKIQQETQASFFHSSAIIDPQNIANAIEIKKMIQMLSV